MHRPYKQKGQLWSLYQVINQLFVQGGLIAAPDKYQCSFIKVEKMIVKLADSMRYERDTNIQQKEYRNIEKGMCITHCVIIAKGMCITHCVIIARGMIGAQKYNKRFVTSVVFLITLNTLITAARLAFLILANPSVQAKEVG